MKNYVFLFVLAAVLSANSAFAQSRHYSAQSLGMGSGGTAYVDGYHANFVNPANLMLDRHSKNTTIGLSSLNVQAGGSIAKISIYNKYLTNGKLITSTNVGTENETGLRVDMLNEWFGKKSSNTKDMSVAVNIAPLGASHRRGNQAFSFASRVRVFQDVSVNKGLAELLTYGLDSDKFANPTPVNFSSNTVSFAEFSVGYARHIMNLPDLFFAKDIKLYAGIAPKYLYGVYTSNLDFRSTFQMQKGQNGDPFTISHDFNYSLQTIGELSRQLQAYEAAHNQNSDAELGDYLDYQGEDVGKSQASGLAVDLGGTLEMDISNVPIPLFVDKEKTLRISMSLTDLGKLNFDKSASSIYAEDGIVYKGAGDSDDINGYFDDLADSLQNDVYGNFSSKEKDAISYSLPGMYNFGTSLEIDKLLVALDYGFGFNNNGVNSRRSSVNLGVQYRFFGFLPVRVGTRLGGYSSAAFSAGLGVDLNAFEFTIGAANVANSDNNGGGAGVAWSGFVVRF